MLHFSLSKQRRAAHQPKRAEIQKWLCQALIYTYKNIYIDISIVHKADSARLNNDLRQKNYATNVISLEYSEMRDEYAMLNGELVLCDEVIVEEAMAQNKSIMAHYAHMVVHGMLHLQGLDHQDNETANHMESIEIEILHNLGYANPYKDTD